MLYNVKRFCFNPMQTNCYVVDYENHAIIIDPCCYFDYEKQELDDYITSNNLKVDRILVTHMHVDHILGLNWCQKKYDVVAEGPTNENHWVETGKQLAKQFGYNIDNDISPITKPFESGEWTIEKNDGWVSCLTLESIHTPGHSPGHLCYRIKDRTHSFPDNDVLFCGDVVFKDGIGRYDFPDSNYKDLQKSIELVKSQIVRKFYPGHGEPFSNRKKGIFGMLDIF